MVTWNLGTVGTPGSAPYQAVAALLSGDAKANDLTRFLPEIRVDVTGQGHLLGLVSAHLKSGTDNLDEFRRAAESFRMNQIAAEAVREGMPLIMMGDLNADRGDAPLTPTWFTSVPGALPAGMVLGAVLQV